MEMGINLAIMEAEITPANAEDTHDAIDDISNLARILQVIPTQSNRTPDQVAFQQFSTPPTLAYLINWLASVGSDNIVLEPSAGTGNLAVFAYNGGASLILNEWSKNKYGINRRANILDALSIGYVYREDGLIIGDHLAQKLRDGEISEEEMPDRVIMNPPFSAAGKQGTKNKNKNGFDHVKQGLLALRDGGRLVAILGAGRDGTASSVNTWLNDNIKDKYNVRAVITSGGKAFQKFGTTFGNVILVIDKGKPTPKNSTIRYNFSGNFDDDEELQKLFDALTAIHNEALGDDFVPFKKSDEAESTDDMLRHLANRQLVLENLDDVEENTEQYSVNPAVRDIITNITKNAPKDKKFPTSLIVQEAKNKGINIAEVAHSINALQDYGEIRTYYDPNYDGEDFDLNHGILFKLTDTSLQSGNDEPDNDSTPPKPEPTKPKPTPETPSKGKHEPVTQEVQQNIPENISNSTARKAINEAEEILSMLHNASFDELRNIAEFLDIDIHPLVDSSNGNGDILSDKLRAAITKKLQPEISQENPKQVKPTESTPQVQETPKPDTQRKPKKEYTPLDEDSPEPESASIYADYVPEDHSNISLFKLAKPHPSKLVETTNMKAVHLPPLTYSPHLPENMIKSGAISASQLEAVAYAGQAFSQTLPSGQTKGFILGDGTGSGKGRTIAAIISDQLNQKHGNGKAVWFSVSADLFKDAQRDTEGIGGNKKDVFELADTKLDATIPADKKGILFTTYMTLITTGQKKQNGNEEEIPSGGIIDKKRLQQIIDWLGADFDGVIAFDECHKINNLGGQDTGFGKSKPSQAADAARMLADALPNARILYVSATSATDPANLRMFDRAGLWGEGTPFHDADQFAEEIRAGGPNAMEMFARDAKALGVFMARSLSWDGVTYRRLTYNLSPTERDMYNEVAQAWRIVDDALSQGFTTVGGDANAGKAILNRDFRREQLQCFNFLLTAFKTNALIQDAQKQLEAGHSVVIQIDSTYDAFIGRILSNLKEGVKLEDVVISPVEDLIGFVREKFPVVKMEQVQDERPNGDTYIQNVIVRDSNGNPVISQEAVKLRDKLIAHLKRVRFNMSPLDNIINSLGGINNVAEITTRTHRLIRQSDGKIIDAKSPPSANKEVDAFNNGKKRVIIFSRAGNTGRSFHADKSFKNTQKRIHYLLEGGFSAFNAIQGFGRTHRSNELYPPEYVVVAVDIPGEIRFISAIVRKLGQMGALTAGDRKNNTQGLYSEKDNMDSQLAQSAMTSVLGNLIRNKYKDLPNGYEIFRQMGFNEKETKNVNKIPLKRVFNRILSLDLDMQDILISYFTMEHEQRLMLAIQNGTADIGTENVRALDLDTVQDTVILEDKAKGIKTKYLELKVKVKSRIRPFENVTEKNHCKEFYTDQDGNIYAARQNGEYDENGDLIRAVLTHTADGEPIEQFTLFTPDFLTSYASDRLALSNKKKNQKRRFTPVTPERAKELWQEQSSAIAKSHIEHIHMISGVLLPVWQKLKQLKSSRVKRVIAPDGSSIIGRIVENSEVQGVLGSFNIRYHGESFSVQDVLNQIQKPKTIARLFNNWKLKYSTVSGEKRIEILYNDYHDIPELEKAGALIEIIGSNERAFIPIGNNDVLQKIIDAHNVTNFENTQTADDILDEAAEKINSNIPDSSKLYFIHPSFRGLFNFGNNQDDNPYIHESPYASPNAEFEKRYQDSKKTEEKKSMLEHLKDFISQVVKGRNDIPELAGDNWKKLFAVDDNLIDAQEWIRGFKRERQANLHETEKILRAILLDIKNPDDFDLFQRAMELQDLHETRNLDINARMPWALNPETLYDFDANDPLDEEYSRIMAFVRNNSRVQGAMAKADILMSDLRQRLISEADRLGMHDLRDKLKRKHYFRHLVLEYYNMQRSGQPHPTFKNPDRRGYTQHREGSDKNISSNWILAMGEVMLRMTDDIKILGMLSKLRKRYDIIDELKKQAFIINKQRAIQREMENLSHLADPIRRTKAEERIEGRIHGRQAKSIEILFKLAEKGDLPDGDNHEWQNIITIMTEAGQLENLSKDEQTQLVRYIAWLYDLPSDLPKGSTARNARNASRNFLMGERIAATEFKKILGDDYIDWTQSIPDDHKIWSPSDSRLVFSASTVPEYMLKLAMENIDTMLGVSLSELGNAINSGGRKQIWVIPTKLADALDNIGKSQPAGSFNKFMGSLMTGFKRWVTIGPVNGRILKYNYRNFFGDLEAVLQGNPGALYYFKQATKELTDTMLKGGEATGLLAEFNKRGGGLTTEFMTELEHPERLKDFSHLFEPQKSRNPIKSIAHAFRAYIEIASTLTNLRESILRYASFLSFVKLIQENGGVPPFYGMSKPKEVLALKDNVFDMAFKLANENLGAYDQVSKNTQWLRDNHFTSFLSWVEVNFSRAIQMYKNIWQGNSFLEYWIKKHGNDFIDMFAGSGGGGDKLPPNNGNGGKGGGGGNNEPPEPPNDGNNDDDEFRKMFRKAAKKSGNFALRLGITLALAAPLYFMAKMWNKLMGADENDPNLDDRNGVSLFLGRNPFTGDNIYMFDIGSAWDFFRTTGLHSIFGGDLRDLLDGRITFGQLVSNILDGPVTKIAGNANPYVKAIVEAAFDKRLYPSALHPSPIRDKGKFVAQSFGLDWYYDWITDKPHKPFLDFSSSVFNTVKQDQSAYFFIQGRKKIFQENVLGKYNDAFTMTRRGEALRNAKRAIDLGDKKSFRKFLREYFRAGGTEQGLKASARASDPLFGLNEEEQMRFIRWLPKEERKILRRAMRYAEKIKAYLDPF